jgi:hypothetical protein
VWRDTPRLVGDSWDDGRMSEENKEEQQQSPMTRDQLTQTSDWHGAPDATLAMMADVADSTSTGINVTLIVSGGALSGQVISAQDFFAAIAQRLRDDTAASGDETKTKLGDDYAKFFDRAAERVAEQVRADNVAFDRGDVPPPRWPMQRYIHLSDARFTVPDRPAFELGHVRILLSQVVGWTGGAKWIEPAPD